MTAIAKVEDVAMETKQWGNRETSAPVPLGHAFAAVYFQCLGSST
jgi:hypothetical protein